MGVFANLPYLEEKEELKEEKVDTAKAGDHFPI
jgi:hypothetical protein